MTRITSLLIAAATVATMVGFATPGEARDLRQGNRCDWVYNGQANYGFQNRGPWQQFQFGDFGFRWQQHQLGPRQIRRALRRQGFYRIRHIEYRRGIYRAVAKGRHGRPRQVFVHPGNGQVLCVSRIRHQGRGYRDTVRRGHDRDFAWERDRQPDRNRNRDTVRRGQATLLDLGRYIRTVGDPNSDPALRSQFAPRSGRRIPDSVARQAALAYDALVQRQRAAAAAAAPPPPVVRRGHDRDFAQNRDRRPDRNRNRNRR